MTVDVNVIISRLHSGSVNTLLVGQDMIFGPVVLAMSSDAVMEVDLQLSPNSRLPGCGVCVQTS